MVGLCDVGSSAPTHYSLNDFQKDAARTWSGLDPQADVLAALGLAGEVGEAVELIKKHRFHGHDLDRQALVGELGDALHYLAALARCYGITLEEVARGNIAKLAKRYPNGFSHEASRSRGVGS